MKKTHIAHVCVVLLLTLMVAPAFAQQQKPTPPPPAQDKKVTNDDIGDLRREGIDVVQNRIFIKRHRSELGAGLGFIFDDPYLRYETMEFRYTYHFTEGLSLEGSYAYAFSQNKAIIKDLENIPCDSPPTLFDSNGDPISDCGITLNPPPDPYKHILNANMVWSPIYGKFSIFSKKILHFDIFLTAGAGYYLADRDNRFGFNIGIGTKVFINQWSAVRIDFRNFTIKEGAPFNHIVNNRILSLGMSFFLPTKIDHEQ